MTKDSKDDAKDEMIRIGAIIAEGAKTFLYAEYKMMAVFILFFGAFVDYFVGFPAMIAFVTGAVTSILAGYVGMRIAVFTNYRCAHECWRSVEHGYAVAINGGSVMGFSLVSLGVLNLFLLIKLFEVSGWFENPMRMYEAVAGYGLGASSIALFGRVGGGIYTKAADVGADLSGKVDNGISEDDPRNPACIADNVGDIAGMGADLFGSFAEATCAGLIIASASGLSGIAYDWKAMMFPLLISSSGILGGLLTMLVVNCFYRVKELSDVEKALKGTLVISTIIMTPVMYGLAYWCLPPSFTIAVGLPAKTPHHCILPIWAGLWSGLIIGYTTEYYTSHTYGPVRAISKTQET